MSNVPRAKLAPGENYDHFSDYQEDGGLSDTEGAKAAYSVQKQLDAQGLKLAGVCDCSGQIAMVVSWAELAAIAGGVSPANPALGRFQDPHWRPSHTLPGGFEPTNCCRGRICQASVAINADDAMNALRWASQQGLLERDVSFQNVKQIVQTLNGRR